MQLGTHLDALSHLQMGDRGYGGFTRVELAGTAGVTRLGVETVPQIVTRGWLVDVPGLGAGEVITPEHCAVDRPRARETPSCFTPAGAAIGTSPTHICLASPAPVASSLSGWPSDSVALTGCDTWSYGPVPPEDPAAPVPGSADPQHRPRRSSSSRTWTSSSSPPMASRRFALILTHPKLRGATGAWTSPIALV